MRTHFSIVLLLFVLLSACTSASEVNQAAPLFIVNSSTQSVCKVHLTSMDGDEIDVLLVSMEHPLDVGENVE